MRVIRALCLSGLPIAATASIAFGVYSIYPPAAFIVVGVLVLIDLIRKDKTP